MPLLQTRRIVHLNLTGQPLHDLPGEIQRIGQKPAEHAHRHELINEPNRLRGRCRRHDGADETGVKERADGPYPAADTHVLVACSRFRFLQCVVRICLPEMERRIGRAHV